MRQCSRDTANAFERLAEQYDDWYRTPLGALCDRLEKKVLFSQIEVPPGARVLDVGCGTGNYMRELVARGASAVGVDLSASMLEIARGKRAHERVSAAFVRARAEALPFRDDTFDVVLAVTLLEFLASPQRALKEIVRVVRPRGAVAVGALNRWSSWALVRRAKGRFTHSIYSEARFFSRSELERMLRSAGADNLRACCAVFVPPVAWPPAVCLGARLEGLLGRIAPGLGAFLAIVGRKAVVSLSSTRESPA